MQSSFIICLDRDSDSDFYLNSFFALYNNPLLYIISFRKVIFKLLVYYLPN